jgi:type II secretory pathway component PulJ
MYASEKCIRGWPSGGYTLLELMLSLALGSALVAGLLAQMDYIQRHKLLVNSQLSLQVAADLGLTVLLQNWRQSCGAGLLAGQGQIETEVWLQVERQDKQGCQSYEYRFFAAQQTVKRRRLATGSRYSPLLSDIAAMVLRFGVDSDGDCQLDRWLTAIPTQDAWQVRQVQVTLKLQTWPGNWRQLLTLPNTASSTEATQMDQSTVSTQVVGIWPVPDPRTECEPI